jgi:transcriptional regulator with XRE-family HTH domain
MSKSLFERRRALALTTKNVAALTGLSRQTVRNYERNRGNYVAQKYQRLTDLYDRLERKAAKAEENKDGRI